MSSQKRKLDSSNTVDNARRNEKLHRHELNSTLSKSAFGPAQAHVAALVASSAQTNDNNNNDDNNNTSQIASNATQFAQLRHWNRVAHLTTEMSRVVASQANAQLDTAALALQNVRYEQRHYEQEIRAAQAVEFDPSPLFLTPRDQLPSSVLAPAQGDAHGEMLARLAHELSERKRMQARVADLKRECADHAAANATLESFLGGLKAKLAGLADTSRPLQQFMALPNATRPDSERTATSLLPTPLYVLFAAANGYREAADNTLVVRIDGDVALASQFQPDAAVPLQPSPLSVVLVFQLADAAHSSTVPIRFAFVPALNVVTVTVLSAENKPAGVGSQDVLVNLIPDDKGESSPNPAHHFDAQHRALKFDTSARPYRWAQCLTGLDFVPLTRDQQVDQRASVSAILGMLKQRLVARRALATQIKSLKQLRLPDLRPDTPVAPVRVRSRITRFVEISAGEYDGFAAQSAGYIADDSVLAQSAAAATPSDSGAVATAAATTTDDAHAMHFFRMTLSRDNAQLSAAMSVAPDYPTQAPRIVLWNSTPNVVASMSVSDAELRKLSNADALRASDGMARNVVPDIELLRAMEAELSLVHVADGVGAADELLARQMRRLVELWEIAQEVSARGDAFGDGGKFCTRSHRGRDRRPPFEFSRELQVFTHNDNDK